MSDSEITGDANPWKLGGLTSTGAPHCWLKRFPACRQPFRTTFRGAGTNPRVRELRLSNHEVSTQAAHMFRGLTHDDLLECMADIPRLPDIDESVAVLKNNGIRLAIATITFDFAAEWFARHYGFDSHAGIVLEFDRHGKATGEIVRHVPEEDKESFVVAEAARHGVSLDQVFYVGDSRSDLPTFKRAGFSVAINASPEARACAHASVNTMSLREALALAPYLVRD